VGKGETGFAGGGVSVVTGCWPFEGKKTAEVGISSERKVGGLSTKRNKGFGEKKEGELGAGGFRGK